MKKTALLLMGISLSASLASCSFSFGVSENPEPTRSETPSVSSETAPISSSESLTSEETESLISEEEGRSDSVQTESSSSIETDESLEESSLVSSESEVVPPLHKTIMAQSYGDYIHNNLYPLSSCPNMGEAHLLVIPVWFNDSSNYISPSKKENVRMDIATAYFGTEEETGWHSVKTYYEKESYGRLEIDGAVSPWYSVNNNSSYYKSDSDMSRITGLVNSAVDWYFQGKTEEEKSYFDADGDGYLDGVMIIYGAPDYSASYEDANDLWAFCYWTQADTSNEPVANAFFWASYDFLYSMGTDAYVHAGSNYGTGVTRHCNIDAHTYIHEMGHVFGLEDYYDYADYENLPAGGFSMQDRNVGGHDPFSTMALGWADPFIPTDDCTIELKPFQEDRDLILLTPQWNDFDSPFDEYLLLEFYTPTGLNAFDCAHRYGGYDIGPSAAGIRLWHVDARLAVCNTVDGSGFPIYDEELTSNAKTRTPYGVTSAFSNTSSGPRSSVFGESYGSYDLLHLIRNDKSSKMRNTNAVSNADLFRDGDSFSFSTFKSQFPNGQLRRMNSGESLGWGFSVTIEQKGNNLTAFVDCYLE